MDIQQLVSRFLYYNLWANERLTAWLMTLDRNLLYKNTGSSFGTIDRTLQHVLSAEVYWHELLTRGTITPFHLPLKENAIEEVIVSLNKTSQGLVNDLSTLSEQQLTGIVKASDSTQSRCDYILHVVNHSSYHRGQVITMCRALGVTEEIPVTDYDAYLWWIENKS